MRPIATVLALAAALPCLPAAAQETVHWRCEFGNQCIGPEEFCGASEKFLALEVTGEGATYTDELETFDMALIREEETGAVTLVSPVYYQTAVYITRFAGGNAAMAVHSAYEGEAEARSYLGVCDEAR